MKKTLVFLQLAFLVAATGAFGADTRVTNPNALSLEGLGRAGLYSINYDRVIDEHLAVGLGYGAIKLSVQSSISMLPIYANFYFSKEGASFFATGGATLVLDPPALPTSSSFGSISLNSSSVIPVIGAGYESRSDAGFLARFAAYALIAKSLAIWGGLSLGWSF